MKLLKTSPISFAYFSEHHNDTWRMMRYSLWRSAIDTFSLSSIYRQPWNLLLMQLEPIVNNMYASLKESN